MGYDLYVCDRDGDQLPESMLDIKDWDDDDAVEAAFARQYDSHTYLRRSMGNMCFLRDALLRSGMGYEAVCPPHFPDYPGDEHFDRDYKPITEVGRRYRFDVATTLRSTGDERPGIPLHKTMSNDGWWVTAAECLSALQLWDRAGRPHHDGFRDDAIPFLFKAAENGGFRVY